MNSTVPQNEVEIATTHLSEADQQPQNRRDLSNGVSAVFCFTLNHALPPPPGSLVLRVDAGVVFGEVKG